jgi:hypothetical protein
MDWPRVLAYVTGTLDQELLARNKYLAAENRILEAQLKGRLKLEPCLARLSAQGRVMLKPRAIRDAPPRCP